MDKPARAPAGPDAALELPHEHGVRGHLAVLGQRCCVAGAALGALGLLGHLSGVGWLTTLVPEQPAMVPNTALSLSLVGTAGALRRSESPSTRRLVLTLLAAGVAFALGLGTLAEYAFDVDLGIDQLLVASAGTAHYPGRPSPPTALALVFLAAAISCLDSHPTARLRPSEWFALSAGLIALAAALGQLFGAGPIYRLEHTSVIGVAVPTAAGLLLTSLGLLLERPHAGVMRVATSPRPGGILLRRLALAAVVGPVLLGIALLQLLSELGVEEFSLIHASLTVGSTVVGLLLLVSAAVPLDRMHDDLVASRARAQDLIDQAVDGIVVADLDGRYIDANVAACRMLGRTREEIVGQNIADFLRPDEVERFTGSKRRILAGASDIGEWTICRGDGTDLPIELSARVLPDGRWQGILRDISERKRTEEALRLSELRLSRIVETSLDAIISVDEDQRITLFNAGAEKIFGYSRQEALGEPLATLIPERFRARHRAHFDRFASGIEVARPMGSRSAAIFGLRKNGEEFPAEASISRIDLGGKQLIVSLRDVSERWRQENERKQFEVALQESEARLRLATEAAEIGTWDYDPRSGVLVWSERERALFGVSGDVRVGHDTFLRGVHPEDRERAVENVERAQDPASGGRYRDEFRTVGIEDGVERWISAQGRCFFDEHGRATRFIGADLDVTERRLAAQRVALLMEASRALVPGSERTSPQHALGVVAGAVAQRLGDACWIALLAEDGETLHSVAVESRGAEFGGRLAPLQAASVPVRGDWLRDALHDRRPLLVPVTDALGRGESGLLAALSPALADAGLTSMMLAPLVMTDRSIGVIACFRADGRAYGRADLVMLQDLADRCALALSEARSFQQAEQARRQIESIIDAVPFLISYVDASGRYAYVGRGYELWFGRPRDHFVGEHVSENVGPAAYEVIRPMMEEALRGQPVQFELTLPYTRGGAREVAATYLPQFDETGRPMGFVAVIVDVSEHKELVASLRRSLRFSDEFVGILGHDLRSPLGAIAMTCDVLLRRLGDHWAAESVRRMQRSTERMNRMIEQILDFTRAHLGGGIPVRPGPMDLATLANELVIEVRSGTGRPVVIASEGDTRGQWDRDRLGQVLTNLLANAVEHGGTGAPVRLELCGSDPDAVRLTIWNEGAIPEHLLPAVFDRFQRGDTDRSRGSPGLGLGLYIARQIVLAHGGTIEARSSRDEGTSFTVRLPRVARADRPAAD